MPGRFRRHFADTRPLQDPHFRRLWTSSIVTVVGAQITVVTVPAQIYADTGSSAYVGLAGLFGLVPLVVFGLYGGALADRVDRRLLLVITTCGLILTSALFWGQAALGSTNVWLLLCLFALQQAFFAANSPARAAILPVLLSKSLLPAANSLSMTVTAAGSIAGPLIAGAALPVTGFAWLYLVDTITLGATLWAVVKLPPLPVSHDATQDSPATGRRAAGIGSVLTGFRYLLGQPVLLMSFVVDIIAMVFGMPRALFPELATVNFHGPPTGGLAFALLFAAIPVGAVLGGVFSGWVSRVRHHGRAITWSIQVWGLGVVGFGAAAVLGRQLPDLAVVCLWAGFALLAVAGAADMSSAAFRQSMLQSATSDDVRGRLQGVFIVVVAGGPRVADVLHGFAAESLGAGWTTVAGGVLVLLLVPVAVALAPAFWRYRSD